MDLRVEILRSMFLVWLVACYIVRLRQVDLEWNMRTKNAAIGLVLFVVYLVLYGGFVLLNAFAPQVMEITPIDGINLAILYGFGLIFSAFALAILYGFLCQDNEAGSQGKGS